MLTYCYTVPQTCNFLFFVENGIVETPTCWNFGPVIVFTYRYQGTRKFRSDSLGLVDFAVGIALDLIFWGHKILAV